MSKKKDLKAERDRAVFDRDELLAALVKVRATHNCRSLAAEETWRCCQSREIDLAALTDASSALVEAITERMVSMGRNKNGHRVNVGAIADEIGAVREILSGLPQ